MKEKKNIVRMRPFLHLNIGVVVFIIIMIYVLFNLVSYLTSDTVAAYEVGQGTIATNHVYQGLILRDETIVYAGQSGYINYYVKNASKVSVTDVIYSIDTDGTLSQQITEAAEDGSLSAELLSEVSQDIDEFRNAYDAGTFLSVASFKEELNAKLSQTLSTSALTTLRADVKTAVKNKTFYKKKSEKPGIIVYYTDGYESMTVDNFTADAFNRTDYKKTSLEEQTQVDAADPVYKRIDSEDWSLLVPVSSDTAKELSDSETVKLRFCKDDYTVTAPFSLLKRDGNYYLNVSLSTAMIRYAGDRFVSVELVMAEKTGLKIPNSAITTKEFFTVPKRFFTQGGDSSDESLLVEETTDGDSSVRLVTPTIYYETDDFYYVDSEDLTAGDVVVKSDSTAEYVIGTDTDELTGVYNINKGYAVFKQIEILTQNDKYTIVATGTSYGVALYDHIALDGSKVEEDQLIVK